MSEATRKLQLLGQLGVNPDYSQNDETKKDYIKNRPFYEGDPVYSSFIPESSLEFTLEADIGPHMCQMPVSEDICYQWLADWSICKVVYDGNEYICYPRTFEGIKCIGDVDYMETGTVTDNAPPFIFTIMDYGEAYYAMGYSLLDPIESQTVTHIISIDLGTAEIHTLDPKFLGDVPWEKIIGKPNIGLPSVTTEDNGKLLQVVDGAWKLVNVSESSIGTYIDDYISAALGGDY